MHLLCVARLWSKGLFRVAFNLKLLRSQLNFSRPRSQQFDGTAAISFCLRGFAAISASFFRSRDHSNFQFIYPGGRVLILINIAKKILISIVFQYRVLIFQALKSIRKSIKKASKSQPKINTGTAAKMQVVFQIACLWSVGVGNYFVDSCLYNLYTCQNLSHNGPFVKDQWSHHFSFM